MEPHDNFAYLLPFILATFGCIFLAGQRFNAIAAQPWGFGYLAAAAGFVAPLALHTLPVSAVAIISNVLFFTAFFFYGHALLVRFKRPLIVGPRLVFAVFALAVVSYLIVYQDNLRAELSVSDASLAILLAVPVWMVRRKASTAIDKLLIAMAGLVVLETIARVAALLLLTDSTHRSHNEFLSSDYAYIMQVTASVIGFLMALAVLGAAMCDVVARYRWAAERDPLTRLLNRRGFETSMSGLAATKALRSGAVIVADIDRFKQINDRFGHAAGDQVIEAFAHSMQQQLPANAAVARVGGEEFVAVVPGASVAEAAGLADALRRSFALLDWREKGIDCPVTASFGVAALRTPGSSIADAVQRADACLYSAKEAGRNQVIAEGLTDREAGPLLRIVAAS